MRKISFLLCFLIAFAPFHANAAEVIRDVEFVGLVSIREDAISRQISSVPGSKYSRAGVNRDIKSLYKTGFFRDVSVEKQGVSGGVKLVFSVTEQQLIGKLTLLGNKKIKDDKLLEVITTRQNDLLDPAKMTESVAAMKKLYEEKGFHLASIEPESKVISQEKNQVELIYNIKENKPLKIKLIKFTGNSAFSDKQLRKKIRTKEKGIFSLISGSGKLEDEKLNTDIQMLRYHYLDNGYLNVKIGDPEITMSGDKQGITISIPVEEGDQYKVGRVTVDGDILTTPNEILGQLKQGSDKKRLYRKSLEMQDLKTLERIYGDQAYAFAQIIPQITPNNSSKEADVNYFIRKGGKIKINRILIKGNKITRDKVIRRELRIFENSYFSQSALELSKQRLYQLGYFETVNVSYPRAESDDKVDVVIDVKEKSTGSFSVGAGFSTLESFIFTASVQKDNFFGRGWRGAIQANVSKLRQDFSVSMADRYFLDTRWYFGVNVQRFDSALNDDFDQRRFGGTLTIGRELFDFFHFRLGYQIDDVSVFNFSSQVPEFFQINSSGLTSALNASVTYDRRDNAVLTTKGYYGTAAVQYAGEELGGNNNYIRFTSDHRVFFKLPKNFVFKIRGSVGYIESLENDPVALFDRFFLGGVNDLRGFDLNTVGPSIMVPKSASGADERFTYGGNKQLLFNAELQIPIYAPAGLNAVVFFDAGNSYAENENFDVTSLRMNYGAGFRWQSPFGPLRFEWGFPINRKTGESSTVFNFTIGQSF